MFDYFFCFFIDLHIGYSPDKRSSVDLIDGIQNDNIGGKGGDTMPNPAPLYIIYDESASAVNIRRSSLRGTYI